MVNIFARYNCCEQTLHWERWLQGSGGVETSEVHRGNHLGSKRGLRLMPDFLFLKKLLRKFKLVPKSSILNDDVSYTRERRLILSDAAYERVIDEFSAMLGHRDNSEMLDYFEEFFLEEGGDEWEGNIFILEFDQKERTVTVCDMFCDFDDDTLPWEEFKRIFLKSKALKIEQKEYEDWRDA
ncbi:MAG: hypothetical protein ABJM43_12570 [Paracoccaceae bacterium]